MKFFVEHARKNNMTVPILCGGAAINSNYINRIAKEGGIYDPGVFYCNTMFEGLKTMDVLISDDKPKLLEEWKTKLENWKEKSNTSVDPATLPRSNVQPVNPPNPKIIGEPIRLKLDQINMDEVWTMIDKKSADFLGLKLEEYNKEFDELVKKTHEITGDILITSPNDFNGLKDYLENHW